MKNPMDEFFVQNNATTLGSAATQAITPSPQLRQKTPYVVMENVEGTLQLRVYRESATAPGIYSIEIYQRKGNSWGKRKKLRGKAATLPDPPPGSLPYRLGQLEIWTKEPQSEASLDAIEELLR